MHIVTSFHASAVRSDQLIGIMTDYVALERARAHRKFLMIGFGALAFAISAASVGCTGFPCTPSRWALGSVWWLHCWRGSSRSSATGGSRAASTRFPKGLRALFHLCTHESHKKFISTPRVLRLPAPRPHIMGRSSQIRLRAKRGTHLKSVRDFLGRIRLAEAAKRRRRTVEDSNLEPVS